MKKILVLLAVVTAVWCASCSKDDDKDPLNDKGGEGVITMVVNAKGRIACDEDVYFAIYSFKEGEIITVDWGDGQVEEFRTIVDENEDNYLIDYRTEDEVRDEDWFGTDYLEHSYERHKYYTITIKGNIKGLVYIRESDYNNVSPLTSLDINRCSALKYLNCFGNHLTSLDASKNTALLRLWCYENALTSLDVSKNTALEILDCSDNKLTSLDVSKNTALEDLLCSDNNLSANALNKIFTDLPQGTGWSSIYIGGNPGFSTCDKSIAEKKGWRVIDYDD